MSEPLRCERSTKAGKPCQSILNLTQVACSLHATEHDKALAARWSQAWKDGWSAAREHPEPCKVCAQRRDDEKVSRFRLTERGGQVVKVSTGYAYVWHGDGPLEVGDRVLLPGNWLFKDPCEAEVTGFGSDYDGTLSAVIRKLAPQ